MCLTYDDLQGPRTRGMRSCGPVGSFLPGRWPKYDPEGWRMLERLRAAVLFVTAAMPAPI